MDKVTLWIKLCSVFAIVSAVLIAVVPECKLKKTYKVLCSVIMIFVFFSVLDSFGNIEFFDYNTALEQRYEMSEKNDKILIEESEKLMNNIIESKLYEGKIEVECKTEITYADDKLTCSCIYLYGSFTNEEKIKAKEIIYLLIEEECEVLFVTVDE